MGSYLRPIAVVFTNPQLRRLQLAWAASMLGTCAYLIALAVVAFRSGGATAVGLIMLVRMVAAAVASPPLSALADRYPRRSVMAISDLVRAVLTAAIALLVETQAPIIAVYALTVGISIVGTPFRPAQAALTPKLAATPVELTASNAVAGTLESASIFLGPGIGGIILAVSGTAGVFVVCVSAFLWSAALVWSINEPPDEPAGEDAADAETPSGMLAGFETLAATPALLAVTVTYAAQAMVAGALTVFAVVLAIDVLHLATQVSGISTAPSASEASWAESQRSAWRVPAGWQPHSPRVSSHGASGSPCSAPPPAPPSRWCSWPASASATRSSTSLR